MKKIVAITAVLSMFCSFFVGFAQTSAFVENAGQGEVQNSAMVLEEEIDLREQNVKHFRLSNGTYAAVVYDSPVHYYEAGKWEEIDNSLKPSTLLEKSITAKNGKELVITGIEYIENSSNNFNVKFPKKITSDTPIFISYNEHEIGFFVEESNSNEAKIKQPMNEVQKLQELNNNLAKSKDREEWTKIQNDYAVMVTGAKSSVEYISAFDGIDINYHLSGQTVKEDIVLRYLPEKESFSFSFVYSGLTPVQREDNSVVFFDEKQNVIFSIAAPYMYDSGDAFSQDVTVTLEKTSNGCRYILTPNREWLEHPEREYPVVLDPFVTHTTQDTNFIYDCGVQESNPTDNYRSYNRIYVGSGSNSTRGMMYFNLAEWPAETGLNGGTITSAYLHLNYYPQANLQTAYNMNIDVYRVTSAWNPQTINWNNKPNVQANKFTEIYISDKRNVTSGQNMLDVTTWVKAHYNSPSTDYGIRLQSRTVSSTVNRVCYISSDYYADTTLRPLMYIYYFAGVKGVRNSQASEGPGMNCQQYAFWLNKNSETIHFSSEELALCRSGTVAEALEITKNKTDAWLDEYFHGRYREVYSHDAILNSDEWLVCMRVGVKTTSNAFDYHFWYRANDGWWYNKHGNYAASERVSGDVINPSIANGSDGWEANGEYFYTSNTIYYAIKE